MFRATLGDVGLLRDSLSSIAEIIDEGIFKISKGGMNLTAPDRAMVVVVNFDLSSKAFEKYELDKEQEIGLNISNLFSVLKRAGAKDEITLNLQDSKLEFVIKNSSKRRFVIPLIEISKEEVPPIEQLEFKAKTKIKPDVLQSGIEDAELVADSVLFEALPSKFSMIAEGDVSRTELELEKENEALIDLKTDGEVRSRYPLDYLKKMIKAAKIADSVSIEFGKDYPMKLGLKAGDKCSLSFILAPRVQEE
jgi:proliferating cell nuclear antigen